MLTVPQEIKDILHQDSAYKNIRIHFPNGERADICNDLIVKDSVSFKESLCSQSELKFGLCEANAFECETVGVGNIKGATIEVACEIECPATVTGAEWKIDLQKYVYPIPYGSYTVSEAKRQADMQHRRIVAYGGTSQLSNNDVRVRAKHQNGYDDVTDSYQPDILKTILMISNSKGFMTDATYTEVGSYATMTVPVFYSQTSLETAWGVRLRCKAFWDEQMTLPLDNTKLFYCEFTAPEYSFEEMMEFLGPIYGIKRVEERLSQLCYAGCGVGGLNSASGAGYGNYIYSYHLSGWQAGPGGAISRGAYILIPYRLEVYSRDLITHTDTIIKSLEYRDPADQIIYNVSLPGYPEFFLNYKYIQTGESPTYQYIIEDESKIDYIAAFNAILELSGLFGTLDRSEKLHLINIKRQFNLLPSSSEYPGESVYPEGTVGGRIIPEDYQSCWYEDEYTKPYGRIVCNYKNTNNEDALYELYINGFGSSSDLNDYQTYEISGNSHIAMYTWTEASIATICQNIAANLAGVSYMPVQFTGRGLPYVEAGDTFEILTASGDSITTIVLNKTTSGEQCLTDEYQSV